MNIIKKRAQAGSLDVMPQFGDSIINEINKVLDDYKIDDIHIVAQDKGALTPTIDARMETVICRALEIEKGTLA